MAKLLHPLRSYRRLAPGKREAIECLAMVFASPAAAWLVDRLHEVLR